LSGNGNLPGNPRTTKPPWASLGITAVILALTLWPNPAQAELSATTPFLCLPCGPSGASDLFRNILLFIPLGVALGARGTGLGTALMLCAAMTGVIEFLQYAVIPGRDAALADIAANTAGGLAGAWLGQRGMGALFMSPRAAAVVTVSWATLGVLAIGLMGWSLPSSLPHGTWYGQWAPFGDEPKWFTGDVIEVTLGRRRLPHWRLADSETRRRELAEDTVRLDARVVSMLPPPEGLSIVALADSNGKLIELNQGERDLSFSLRTKAALIALHSPWFVRRDVMPPIAGDTLVVEGTYWRGYATLNGESLELSALDGWSLVMPAASGTALAVLVTILWLIALFAPIGWYGGQVPSSAWAAAPVLVLLADAVMMSRLGGTPYPASWEVAVATLAAFAGRVAVAALEPTGRVGG
jgi:hypothetical protein